MRRLFTLSVLLLLAFPVGVSLSGCGSSQTTFCPGSTGIRVGQITSLTLQPQAYGKSLDFGQIDSVSAPAATDCTGASVAVSNVKYASTNQNLVDINPGNGQICGGQWNRNSGNGIADYTTCTPTSTVGTALVTASVGGATSNQIPVYVHTKVVSVVIGTPTIPATYAQCSIDPSPASNCFGLTQSSPTPPIAANPYLPTTCLSQNQTAQVAARAFDANGNNITKTVGHLTFSAVTSNLVSFDQNGVATAKAPGSTIVSAAISTATSTAGFFSVCPPASITITTPNTKADGTLNVNLNNTESITATVKDTTGATITGLTLTYTSTTPTTVAASSAGILPTFPSSAAINAFCQPPTCNPSPPDQIGTLGNGKPVVSNTIVSNTTGNNSTLLWIASTNSRYLTPVDFTNTTAGTPIQLPYVPNSMVITQDGKTIYLGSDTELMSFTTLTNAIGIQDTTVKGTVLAVAPDNSSIVISDPVRKIVYIYTAASGNTSKSFAGVGTRAQYTPDAKTVYVTTADNQLLIWSAFTSWHSYDESAIGANDVVAAVPAVGAYVGGNSAIIGRSYCANTTLNPIDYYPVAGQVAGAANRLAATNDAKHILGVAVAAGGGVPTLDDVIVQLPLNSCPAAGNGATFTNTLNALTVSGVNAATVTGIVPSSDSALAFITYTAPSGAASTGTVVPAYQPTASGPGTLSSVTLAAGATAPVAGIFASDNLTFYVGTSGDNLVHLLTKDPTTGIFTDSTRPINPNLTVCTPNGTNPCTQTSTPATPNLLVQTPRKTT